jgi:phosphoserine aminotransferase
MSQGKINFNAGPAAMPPEVLHEMAKAVKAYKKTGISILELPHRGLDFREILQECNQLVKALCALGDDYEVLWLQGGGRMQFAMLPMNYLTPDTAAAYIDSGHWANEAIAYALHYGTVKVVASSKENGYTTLPEWPKQLIGDSRYLHMTTNNTIYGTQYKEIPPITVPLVADMSSDILGVNRDYSRFDMFYAATQKNLGTPGLALVAIRKSFLEQAIHQLPPMLSYQAQIREKGILNTANVSATYVALLMLRWIKAKGLNHIIAENERKAALVYQTLLQSSLYVPYVTNANDRSIMNAVFTLTDPSKENSLSQFCSQNGIIGIEGHRSVGGFRVSLYNAIEYSSVETLCEVLREFERRG